MYSLSFTGFLKQYRIKNIWSLPGIELRTACIVHKHSAATELRQPFGEQTLQFCIYTVKGYCYATVSLSTDQRNFSFFKDSYYLLNFSPHLIYYFTISFSTFFYSLDVFSLFHRLFKQYRIKNIWSPPGIEPRNFVGLLTV